jgi:hypothetical protein
VEALVRYAKSDLVVPADDFGGDLAVANAAAVAWCAEVNTAVHSQIAAGLCCIERSSRSPTWFRR